MNKELSRSNNLDVVRFAAAGAVIFGHAFPLNSDTAPGFLSNGVQTIAVKVFFVLSGFLIAQSWTSDQDWVRFSARRALRLFPGLALVLLLTAFVLGPVFTTLPLAEYFASPRLWSYLGNIRLNISYDLPGVFGNNPYPGAVNGSLWSLPVEVCMYALTPLLLVIGTRSGWPRTFLWLVVLASMGASAFYLRASPRPAELVFYGMSRSSILDVAPYYAVGALAFVSDWHRRISTQAALLALFLAVMFPIRHPMMDEVLLTLLLPMVVFGLGFAPSPEFSRVGRFGDVSYGLYLYGFPVAQAVTAMNGRAMTPVVNAVISLAISLALAFVSWHLVEKNGLKFRPRAPRS